MTTLVNRTLGLKVFPPRRRDRVGEWAPSLIIAPSLIASFVYVFAFARWTLYISMSNSPMLPR
jgi:glucose/mannose transport system permease protein